MRNSSPKHCTFRNITLIAFLLGFAISVLFLNSCRQLTDPHGVPLNIPHYYWNYYLRGVAYSLVDQWGKAAKDFEIALGYQAGAVYPEPTEKRRTKTYGMHFLDNYFPHRELGISYYYQGRIDSAEEELTTSLKMLPSSRAKAYLNKVRQSQLIHHQGQLRDPIRFDIELIPDLRVVNTGSLTIDGRIFSPYPISRVTINDDDHHIELAQKDTTLFKKLSLPQGAHRLVITALDLAGRSGTWEKEIFIDWDSPAVSISPSANNPQQEVTINVTDNQTIGSLTINGKRIKPAENQPIHREIIPVQPNREIKIEAIDPAGNKTLLETSTNALIKASINSHKQHQDNRQVNRTFDSRADNQYSQTLTSDYPIAFNPFSSEQNTDTLKPTIRLPAVSNEEITVTTEDYILDIAVEDNGLLESVAIVIKKSYNTEELRQLKCNKYRRNYRLPLQPEPAINTILVQATDWQGNTQTKRLNVIRKSPAQFRHSLRMTLATLTLPPNEKQIEQVTTAGIVMFLTKIFDGRLKRLQKMDVGLLLQNHFAKSTPKRFQLVERNPESMQQFLLEQKIVHSSLADYRLAIKTGKMLPAEWLLQAHIFLWSGKDNWELIAKIIDAQTGEILLINDMHFEGFNHDEVTSSMEKLTDKILQQLPLLSSSVNEKEGKSITLGLGSKNSIKTGFRVMFMPPGGQENQFIDPLTWNGQWIQGRVIDVHHSDCLLEIYPPEGIDSILPHCQAIVR